MGTDWERIQGQGGAYLVGWAAAALLYGELTPMALRLVEEEVERLKFILDEGISRLEPAGDLTPEALAALRTHYHARLDAAENVLAAARRMASTPPTRALPQRAREEERAPTLPSPVSGGGKEAPQRSLRKLFAGRSILIL